MKEVATKSTSISQPNIKSDLSFSVTAGSLIGTLGTFTPLWSFIVPPSITSHIISVPRTSFTLNSKSPSSTSIDPPGFMSSYSSL